MISYKNRILSIVIIGELGNLRGTFWASTFMVLLPEILRFVGLPDTIETNIRQIIYGIIFWQERSENR